MGTHRVRFKEFTDEERLHWTGLPPNSVRVALVILVGLLTLDVFGQLFIVVERSWDALVQGRILDAWDLLKAAAISLLLCWAARTAKSRNLAAFGVLFLLIGFEDQIRIHSRAGQFLGRLLRSAGLMEGRTAASRLGGALAVIAMATAGAALVWSWRRPALRSLRRSRTILSTLLVLLFLLAAVLNFVGPMMKTEWLGIAEEVGERLVLSAAFAYAGGLATVREWWALP